MALVAVFLSRSHSRRTGRLAVKHTPEEHTVHAASVVPLPLQVSLLSARKHVSVLPIRRTLGVPEVWKLPISPCGQLIRHSAD